MAAYDVAILGAGPAGSVTALVLARAGVKTVLIDGSSEDAPRRGETLAALAAPVLARLWLTDAVARLKLPHVVGFVSSWGSRCAVARSSLLVPEANTLVVDRHRFDRTLRDEATGAGATLLCRRIRSAERDGKRWRIHALPGGEAATEEFFAHVLVDASGRGARFARRCGARLLAIDKLVAVTAVLEATPADADRSVRIESVPDGWLFATLDASGNRVVSFFTDGDLCSDAASADAKQRLDQALARSETMAYQSMARQAHGCAHAPIRYWSATTATLNCAVGPGLIAVGDAAQSHDPLSSQGITRAMEDAESAALALIAAFDGDPRGLDRHEQLRRRTFVYYLQKRHRYYAVEQRWADQTFWRRRHDVGALSTLATWWRESQTV